MSAGGAAGIFRALYGSSGIALRTAEDCGATRLAEGARGRGQPETGLAAK